MSLTRKERAKLGLKKRIEVFWNTSEEIYKTRNGQTPKIKQASGICMIVAHYSIIAENKGYSPYLGETSYDVKGHKLEDIKLNGDVSLEEITHYCLGSECSKEDWPRTKTRYVPAIFFKKE